MGEIEYKRYVTFYAGSYPTPITQMGYLGNRDEFSMTQLGRAKLRKLGKS